MKISTSAEMCGMIFAASAIFDVSDLKVGVLIICATVMYAASLVCLVIEDKD